VPEALNGASLTSWGWFRLELTDCLEDDGGPDKRHTNAKIECTCGLQQMNDGIDKGAMRGTVIGEQMAQSHRHQPVLWPRVNNVVDDMDGECLVSSTVIKPACTLRSTYSAYLQ